MPWRYYRRYPWRRRRFGYRRFRKPIWRRRRRWRWVSQPKKLKTLLLKEWQPKCIRKCKIEGYIPLFVCNRERFAFNYDLYETSIVPQHLPGGGGFSIKNFSLQALFDEHEHARNFWTKTNMDLPLCRFLGCKLTLFQSENTDYIVSYSNQLPLVSNLAMYNTMQPSLHHMTKHSILVQSKQNKKKRKPYYTIRITPPTQLQNKWYFQSDLVKTPLVMLRASAFSSSYYYQGTFQSSSNITIPYINTNLFQQQNFKNYPTSGYSCKGTGTSQVYLYTTDSTNPINDIPLKSLIFLGNTRDNKPGISPEQMHIQNNNDFKEKYLKNQTQHWGNPFYHTYLDETEPVFQSTTTWSTIASKLVTNYEAKVSDIIGTGGFTQVYLVHYVRYNPFRDAGKHNSCYFKQVTKSEFNWEKPTNEELYNEGLPLWLLTFGFPDYQKKIKKQLHIDNEYALIIQTDMTDPIRQPLMPISESFIEGRSPYEKTNNPIDNDKWYPQFQYQTEIYNIIASCGPGTPKLPPDYTIEAKIKYQFYFKWGGKPPPMSIIEDPALQPTYPIPSNKLPTNSLQNPAINPERLLYSFDQRHGQLTEKALQRMQKDFGTKESFITDAGERFQVPIHLQQETTPEETSEEEKDEEETLYRQLQRQRLKQQQLKQQIILTLQKLQNIE
nr:MAG: ORF1 [TTV-like mini virus]